MVKSIDEINDMLKYEMESVFSKEYSLETEQYIVSIFNKLNDKIKPQTIVLQDIKYIKPALKVEYLVDNKHFTLIVDVKRG